MPSKVDTQVVPMPLNVKAEGKTSKISAELDAVNLATEQAKMAGKGLAVDKPQEGEDTAAATTAAEIQTWDRLKEAGMALAGVVATEGAAKAPDGLLPDGEEGRASQPDERPPDSGPHADQHAGAHELQPNIALAPQVEPPREQGSKQNEALAEEHMSVASTGPTQGAVVTGQDQGLAEASSHPDPDGVQVAQPAQIEQLLQAGQTEQRAQAPAQSEPPTHPLDEAGEACVEGAAKAPDDLAAQPGERPPDHAPQPNIALAPQVEPAREQGRKQDEAEAEGQTAVGVAGPRRSSAGAGQDQGLAVGASSPTVPDGVQSAQPAQAEQLAQATQHPRPEQKAQREQTEPPKQTEQTEQTEPTEPTEQTGQTGQTAQPLPEQTAEARVRKTWLMSLMSGISRRIFARASLSCRKFRGPWSPRLWSLRLWSPRRHSRRSWRQRIWSRQVLARQLPRRSRQVSWYSMLSPSFALALFVKHMPDADAFCYLQNCKVAEWNLISAFHTSCVRQAAREDDQEEAAYKQRIEEAAKRMSAIEGMDDLLAELQAQEVEEEEGQEEEEEEEAEEEEEEEVVEAGEEPDDEAVETTERAHEVPENSDEAYTSTLPEVPRVAPTGEANDGPPTATMALAEEVEEVEEVDLQASEPSEPAAPAEATGAAEAGEVEEGLEGAPEKTAGELEDGDAKKRRRRKKPKEVPADEATAVDAAEGDEEGLAAQPDEQRPDPELSGDHAPQVEPAREQGRKQDEAEAEGQTAVGVAGPRRSSAGAGQDQGLAVGASSPPVPDGVQSAQPAQAEQLAQATQHPRPEQKAQREQTEPKQTEQTEQTEQPGQTAQPLPEPTSVKRDSDAGPPQSGSQQGEEFDTFECEAGDEVRELGIFPAAFPPDPVEIYSVTEGSWASRQGVVPGDILVAINGQLVPDKKDMKRLMRERPLRLTFQRPLAFETAEESEASDDIGDAGDSMGDGMDKFECRAGQDVQDLGIYPSAFPPDPMLVARVAAGSWAAEQGILAGDELLEIGGRPVQELTAKEAKRAMRERPLLLVVQRADQLEPSSSSAPASSPSSPQKSAKPRKSSSPETDDALTQARKSLAAILPENMNPFSGAASSLPCMQQQHVGNMWATCGQHVGNMWDMNGIRCYVPFCYVLLCAVIFCYVLLCSVMFCYVLLCSVMFCYVLSCSVMFCHVLSCSVMFCYVLLCSVMFCYVLLCSVMFCCVVLCPGALEHAGPDLIGSHLATPRTHVTSCDDDMT